MMLDPIALFSEWLNAAKIHPAITEPTAMCLATADAKGVPSARIVLLKGHDVSGFTFFTNLESRKSDEIKANAKASLCFYWMALERQVRIEGDVVAVSDAESDAYYASRARESRIGAWSSKQSRPLEKREDLLNAVAENTAKYKGKDVPRPPFWSGWRVVPNRIEFWQQSDFRLHDRTVYERNAKGSWDIGKLYP